MLEPMLATLAAAPLEDPGFVYEPKYDGIRAIVEIPGDGQPVRLWSRLGNDKTPQFPEVADALARWAARRREPVVLDGEIVALNESGDPIGFQNLQGRIHLHEPAPSRRPNRSRPSRPARSSTASVAFIAFDLLKEGHVDWRSRPLTERRAALERIFSKTGSPILRVSEQVRGNGRALYERAQAAGWEGLIAKHAGSRYQSGKRTPDWRKLKIVHEQELVIGGWTEPRNSRAHFGALLLGTYEAPSRFPSIQPPTSSPLLYAGHVGTGFDERELTKVMKLLKPLETTKSPFATTPKTNERPHWVRAELVAQVRFTEWTADGILRHPVYLGLRDDMKAADVRREDTPVRASPVLGAPSPSGKPTGAKTRSIEWDPATAQLIERLRALERERRDGVLDLPGGTKLTVTNLHKIFWPDLRITKGDLFRYYVEVAPFLLPAIADRPLVMKRFPNGIAQKPFYQHRVEDVPRGVRLETVGVAEDRPQLVGGDLATLIHTTQLAAISQDPWFSRVGTLAFADYVALDLDPAPGVAFAQVLDVARWIRDELTRFGGTGFPKTSGADGLHVYIPLPPRTTYESGLLFAQVVATLIAEKHPKVATVERSVRARGRKVYVDYLQNIQGKTLASAYSVRASDYAGVSTPLSWKEVDGGIDREAFTIRSVSARLRSVGDLWAPLARSRGLDLARIVGRR